MVEKFSDKKGMARLNKRAGTLKLENGAMVSLGMAVVTGKGNIVFGGPLVTGEMLPKLARWVEEHVDSHPDLAYLSGSEAAQIDARGKTLARYADASLWANIPSKPVAGSLGETAAYLSGLQVGENSWIWMSEGVSQQVICVVPVSDDPKAETFGAKIMSGRKRSGQIRDPGVRGTVRRLKSGALLISTSGELSGVGERLNAWFGELGDVLLVRVTNGEVTDSRRLGGSSDSTDLSKQIAALSAIKNGATYTFWFSQETKNGSPLLLLDESRSALKALAMEVATKAPAVRGQVVQAKWGLEFRSQKPAPDFLDALAGWVSANRSAWPGLLSIVDARMTVRDKNGDIQERYKNSKAWAPMRPKEN